MTLRIGFDIDDVIHPWYETAHLACVRAGLARGARRPRTWHPYEEYGVSRDQWWEVLHQATITGDLYSAPRPDLDAAYTISDLRAAIDVGDLPRGSVLVAVTARGETFDEHPEYPWLRDLIQAQTHAWLRNWGLPFDEVIFSASKGEHELDYLIDDSAGNVRSVIAHGGAAFLLDKTWNQQAHELPRVKTVRGYATKIMEDQ